MKLQTGQDRWRPSTHRSFHLAKQALVHRSSAHQDELKRSTYLGEGCCRILGFLEDDRLPPQFELDVSQRRRGRRRGKGIDFRIEFSRSAGWLDNQRRKGGGGGSGGRDDGRLRGRSKRKLADGIVDSSLVKATAVFLITHGLSSSGQCRVIGDSGDTR